MKNDDIFTMPADCSVSEKYPQSLLFLMKRSPFF